MTVTTTATVHLVSADADALLDVVERAEDSFMSFGVAPTVRRPVDLPVDTAREYARANPNTADGDWLPALSPAAVDRVAADLDADGAGARLHHAGVTGMAVVERLLREETEGDPAVYLQADERSAGVATGYSLYRYAGPDRGYERVTHERLL